MTLWLAQVLGAGVFGQETVRIGKAVRVCPTVEASDPPVETMARLATEHLRWFGVYDTKSGRKLGWFCGRQELIKLDSRPVIRFENSSEFTFSNGGKVTKNFLREEYFFSRTAPYTLLQLNAVEKKSGSSRVTELKLLGKDDYTAEIREGKEIHREQLAGLRLTALQFLSASTWAVSAERKAGQHFVATVFDVRDLIPYAERHEWRGVAANGSGGAVVDSLDTNGMFKTVLTYDAKGLLMEANVAGATTMRLEPEAKARQMGAPVDLHLQSEVPADRILGQELRDLKGLTFQLRGEDVRGVPDTDRQAVSLLSREDQRECTIHVRKGIGLRRLAKPDEAEANLLATAQLPLGDARIISLAKKAVGDATAPAEKVERLLKFVSTHITDDILAEPVGIFELLKNRRGDCTEHALLFTALARASGIPCREATGFIYLGDSVQRFGGHAWNEVVLDGHWHEVDPTWNLFHLTPGHILLSSGKATAKDLRFLSGGLEIKITRVE